jgi:O-antigen ligase
MVHHDVLSMLDHALPIVLIIKLSGAWFHPSFTPSDTAPAIALINGLFLAFCLYGTARLMFLRAAAALFAEPAYLALLLFALVTVTLSVSPANSLGMVRTAALFFGACVFLRYRFSPKSMFALFAAVMGALMVLSLLAAIATPLGVMSGFDYGRWRGVFNHKNTLGENAAVTLLAAGGLYLTGSLHRYWLGLVAAVSAICLVMSGSATSLAAVAISAVVFLMAFSIVQLRILRDQAWLLLLTLVAVLALGGYAIIEVMAASLGRDMTFTGRTEIWEQFLHFAQQRPWCGWGWVTISTTDTMLPIIRQTLGLPFIQTPHNGYLSLLVEMGIIGLALFAIWLGWVFLAASRRAAAGRESLAMIRLAVVSGLMVHSAFESTSGALPSLWLLLLFATNSRVRIRWH